MLEDTAQIEMPKYKCHKVVHALKIAGIDNHASESAIIYPSDSKYAPVTTDIGWMARFKGGDDDLGYYVVYEDGFTSWSPTKAFEEGYSNVKPGGLLNFGQALEQLKAGRKVWREGWNGKDQFVFLVKGDAYQRSLGYGFGEYVGEPTICSGLAIKTTKNEIQMGWLATQSDMLAEDWLSGPGI